MTKPKGKLIIIGGREDTHDEQAILKAVAACVTDDRTLVIMTAATEVPKELAAKYDTAFRKLGVRHIRTLDIATREDGHSDSRLKKLKDAGLIFFTGGDQLRITSQLADSPVFRCVQELYHKGVTIAGTSAGAAAMPATMLISGPGDESGRISALGMAPGLGLIEGVVIDSHFAERGRIGRLLGAVAQNPANLGIGIDEDTAIIVEAQQRFQVLGSGAVYVVDGADISYSSLSEKRAEGVLSIYGVRLHVLGEGDSFDLESRTPAVAEAQQAGTASS